MTEYIITNVNDEEAKILENHNIDWYPDSLESRDVTIDDKKQYERALELLNRKAKV